MNSLVTYTPSLVIAQQGRLMRVQENTFVTRAGKYIQSVSEIVFCLKLINIESFIYQYILYLNIDSF